MPGANRELAPASQPLLTHQRSPFNNLRDPFSQLPSNTKTCEADG